MRRCSSASLASGTARKRFSTCCSTPKLWKPATAGAAGDEGCCARAAEARKRRKKEAEANGKPRNRDALMKFPVPTLELKRLHQHENQDYRCFPAFRNDLPLLLARWLLRGPAKREAHAQGYRVHRLAQAAFIATRYSHMRPDIDGERTAEAIF